MPATQQAAIQEAYPNLAHLLAEEEEARKTMPPYGFLVTLYITVTDSQGLTITFDKRVSNELVKDDAATRGYAEHVACELLTEAKFPEPNAPEVEANKALEKDANGYYLPYQRPAWDTPFTKKEIQHLSFRVG
ncbi:hypothetical protein [Hymenobacter sp. BT491]|uniref:hypothetical protein n=1 Tax=Hymenobacter sp. BT491 TaxID=2766779 RepID=UPI001653D3CC|nr:hypothetical protein [Hymenobacter sp. BT491]MBC6988944.1 hypothetical protein [Hymenobacter sp. BT491]